MPSFQNESKCETFDMKMSSGCRFIFMQIKVIFVRVVSQLLTYCDTATLILDQNWLAMEAISEGK